MAVLCGMHPVLSLDRSGSTFWPCNSLQRPLTSHSLVIAFLQGITHIVPPVCPYVSLWDLNLVLQKSSFEPIRDIPLFSLTHKSELVAFTCATHRQGVGCVAHSSFALLLDVQLSQNYSDPESLNE